MQELNSASPPPDLGRQQSLRTLLEKAESKVRVTLAPFPFGMLQNTDLSDLLPSWKVQLPQGCTFWGTNPRKRDNNNQGSV